MGLYKRAGTDKLWCSYNVDGRQYQESTGTADRRAAASFLAQRRRDVADGRWRPRDGSADRPTVSSYAKTWLERRRAAGVLTVEDEAARLKTYIEPHLGECLLEDVKRQQVADLVLEIQTTPSRTTRKPLAPRTVLHIYSVLRTLFADAVAAELVKATPCTLKTRKGELPLKRDADPRWRDGAVYTRTETESLISSPLVPLDRRAYYGLMLLAGLRASEAGGVRWRDYDPDARPLGRLLVATQAEGAGGGAGAVDRDLKTVAPRRVPVHPLLAQLLAEWKRSFAAFFGRHPRAEDLIVPSRSGLKNARGNKGRERLVDDLARLELRVEGRRRHAMRATFRSLAIESGAQPAILDLTMWARPTDVRGGYERFPWAAVCAEVAKLELRTERAEVLELKVATTADSDDSRYDSPSEPGPFLRKNDRGGGIRTHDPQTPSLVR
jgi:integrase